MYTYVFYQQIIVGHACRIQAQEKNFDYTEDC